MADSRRDEFIELLTQHQGQLFGYIFALVQNMADAEDLYQKTSIVLWEKFDTFETNSDFVGWACQTAKYQVLNFLRVKRRSRVCFSETLVSTVAETQQGQDELLTKRTTALQVCLGKLKAADRELVELCYGTAASIKSGAESLKRSPDSVYKVLNRVRTALMHCINQRLEKQ